jgi:hypothetical protein
MGSYEWIFLPIFYAEMLFLLSMMQYVLCIAERLFINFGKADVMSPVQLIEVINLCLPGKV